MSFFPSFSSLFFVITTPPSTSNLPLLSSSMDTFEYVWDSPDNAEYSPHLSILNVIFAADFLKKYSQVLVLWARISLWLLLSLLLLV